MDDSRMFIGLSMAKFPLDEYQQEFYLGYGMTVEKSTQGKRIGGWTALDYVRHGKEVPVEVHQEALRNSQPAGKVGQPEGDTSLGTKRNEKHRSQPISQKLIP